MPGVLSYDVDAPDPGATVESTIARGAIGATVATVLGIVGGYLALNVVPSQRVLTWVLGTAVPVAGFGLAATRLRGTSRARRRKAVIGIALLSLFGLLITVNSVRAMRPTFPQLAAALSDSALPDGYERIREVRTGDRLCHDGCPHVERYYATPAGVGDPVREMVTSMYRHGWSPADRNVPDDRNTAAVRDDVRADLAPLDGGQVKITLAAR